MKIFNIRFAYHEMLRTKCINIYLMIFGLHFQLGLYREYAGDLTGEYLGLRVSTHVPFNPFRFKFFIPSYSLIEDTLTYYMRLEGGYALVKKIKYSYSRYAYRSKN